jgi:hypothetical protein
MSTVFCMDIPLPTNTCVLHSTCKSQDDTASTSQMPQEHVLQDTGCALSVELISKNNQKAFRLASVLLEDDRYESITDYQVEQIMMYPGQPPSMDAPSMDACTDERDDTDAEDDTRFESADGEDDDVVLQWIIFIGDPQAPEGKLVACAHFHTPDQSNIKHTLRSMAVYLDPDIEYDEHGLENFNELVCHLERR